jgi:CBS domain containing-hemolysin-like protein
VDLSNTDVETVGGLLAQQLGRVPVPGAVAEVAGLRLHAEGGNDRRGRLRITTVTVDRVPAQQDPHTYRPQVYPAAAEPPQEASDTRA